MTARCSLEINKRRAVYDRAYSLKLLTAAFLCGFVSLCSYSLFLRAAVVVGRLWPGQRFARQFLIAIGGVVYE